MLARLIAAALLLAPAALAAPPALIERDTLALHHGWYLDLDRRVASTSPEGADLRFRWDGATAVVEPVRGARLAQLATADIDRIEDASRLQPSRQPLLLTRGEPRGALLLSAESRSALLRLVLPADEDLVHLVVELRARTTPGRQFAGPVDPRPTFDAGGATLRWTGPDGARYRVWRHVGGAWVRVTDVDRPELRVAPLPSSPVRYRVARELGPDRYAEAGELTLCGGTTGVVVRTRDVPHYGAPCWVWMDGARSGLPDLAVETGAGLSATPPGGLQRVGHGEAAFAALREAPRFGYMPVLRNLRQHDVIAVRTVDGRHAKVLFLDDVWSHPHLRIVLAAGGGRAFADPRVRLRATNTPRGLTVEAAGAALAAGERFRLFREAADGALEVVATDAVATFIDRTAPARSVLRYAVARVDAHGQQGDLAWGRGQTLPAGWRLATLEVSDKVALTFAGGRPRAGAKRPDLTGLFRSGSAYIDCPHGGLGGRTARLDHGFGRLAGVDLDALAARLRPGRVQLAPQSNVAWCRTARGELVQLRIAEWRRRGGLRLETIWIPR